MNRFFLRITPTMWVVLTATVAIVVVIARQQPLPPQLAMLHLTDCAPPCWIGITPGITPADQVKARIEAVYGDPKIYRVQNHDPFSDDSGFDIWRSDNTKNAPMTVSWSSDTQGIVDTLMIIPPEEEVSDVATFFGTPLQVSIEEYDGAAKYDLWYPSADIASSDYMYLNPNGLFTVTIDLHDGINAIIFSTRTGNLDPPWQPWRGFNTTYTFTP